MSLAVVIGLLAAFLRAVRSAMETPTETPNRPCCLGRVSILAGSESGGGLPKRSKAPKRAEEEAGMGRAAVTGPLKAGLLRLMTGAGCAGPGVAGFDAVGVLNPDRRRWSSGSLLPRRSSPGEFRLDDVRELECECDRGGRAWSSAACISAAGIGTHFFLEAGAGGSLSSLALSDEDRVLPALLFAAVESCSVGKSSPFTPRSTAHALPLLLFEL